MIDEAYLSFARFAGIVLFATWGGLFLSRLLPWSLRAREVGTPFAAALLIAPFLAGACGVISLTLLPQANHTTHLLICFLVLALLSACNLLPGWQVKKTWSSYCPPYKGPFGSLLLFLLFIGCGVSVLAQAVLQPLVENDALEYATVARELYHKRDLANYPMTNPESSVSGFYAPWSHPPLFVGLQYLMLVVQGNASEAGYSRLVGPWFLLVSAWGTAIAYKLFSRTNRCWIAGVLLLSTPLLHNGVAAGSIDSLVVAGVTLILLVLIGLRIESVYYAPLVGSATGVAMWTHAQSVLLIPLVAAALLFQIGVRAVFRAMGTMVVMVVCAVFVGGGWYLRNYLTRGFALSDSPPVVLIESLSWTEYIQSGRGLVSFPEIMQYGLLRGWHMPEYYGWLFWLASGGAFLLLLTKRSAGLRAVLWTGSYGTPNNVLYTSLFITASYFAGIGTAKLVGIDDLLKNGRYALMISPCLAVLGCFCVERAYLAIRDRFIASIAAQTTKEILLSVAFLVAMLLVLPLAYTSASPHLKRLSDLYNESRPHLNYQGPAVHQRLGDINKDKSLVLALRPADMYYAQSRMISYIDPRMEPFYRAESCFHGARILEHLGVRYVSLPPYSFPMHYNSQLMQILCDPRKSSLLVDEGSHQIYELAPDASILGEVIELAPREKSWTRTLVLRGGLGFVFRALAPAGGWPMVLSPTTADAVVENGWFRRHFSVIVSSGLSGEMGWNADSSSTFVKVVPGDYILELAAHGDGYCNLYMSFFDDSGNFPIKTSVTDSPVVTVGELVLPSAGNEIVYKRRIRVPEDMTFARFGLDLISGNEVHITRATLTRVIPFSEWLDDVVIE